MSRRAQIAETFTLLTTGVIKLVGLVSATNQLLITHHPSSLALAISALFVAGGTAVEGAVLAALDKIFPAPPEKK